MSITAFSFGEWLPDLPDLGNPGLTEALNVLPVDATYTPYLPLSTSGNAIPLNASATSGFFSAANGEIYVFANATSGGVGKFYSYLAGTFISASTNVASAGAFEFAQLENLIVAAAFGNGPMAKTAGSLSDFTDLATSGTAIQGGHVGIVNQFVVLGRPPNSATNSVTQIRWSAIGDGRNWPTPNSATAIATQAGEQFFDGDRGYVTGVVSGDQYGIVTQEYALNRMTYVGPPVVFQFDVIDSQRGAFFDYGTIRVNGLIYFVSRNGFCVTDGVTVKNLSDRKTFRTFVASATVDLWTTFRSSLRVGTNPSKKLIFWSYPSTSSGNPDKLIIYNYQEDRWTHADQACQFIFGGDALLDLATGTTLAQMPFGMSGNKLGTFSGSPGTATLITGEVEPNPGGCAFINGIKPVIASAGTAPTVGVQVGSRDDQSTTVSYAATITPTSRTGFADFRADNRYHRARVYITGDFQKAQGIEVDAVATGGL